MTGYPRICLNKQDSECALGPKIRSSCPEFWIWQSSEYCRVLNMQALHSNLNMPDYTLISLDSILNTRILTMARFWISKKNRIQNILQYDWKCLNRKWICLTMSRFTIIDRILNMFHTIHSARSLYKIMSTFWELDVFRTLSNF